MSPISCTIDFWVDFSVLPFGALRVYGSSSASEGMFHSSGFSFSEKLSYIWTSFRRIFSDVLGIHGESASPLLELLKLLVWILGNKNCKHKMLFMFSKRDPPSVQGTLTLLIDHQGLSSEKERQQKTQIPLKCSLKLNHRRLERVLEMTIDNRDTTEPIATIGVAPQYESNSEDVDEVMVMEEPNGHKNVSSTGTSNGACCSKGTRIILGWNYNDVDIVVINQDDQSMHVHVWVKADRKEFFCTFVYAHNRPWCILGDFNAALFLHDYSVGNSNIDISMREFKECVEDLEILDVQYSGLQFTWTQKPKGNEGLLKKIDRVMANLKFNDVFAGSHAIFKPYRNSDHAPSVLCISSIIKPKPKPFKFYNLFTSNDNFKRVVLEGWSKYVSEFHMFRVTKKLKLLKKPLRKLLYEKGNLHTNVNQLRNDLDQVQVRLDADPFNESIREEEATILVAFNDACLMEEKSLISRSRIDVVSSENGKIFKNEHVADAFVNHYKMFLGQPGITSDFCDIDLFRVCLDENVSLDMTRQVTLQEVKSALFSMGNDKYPGPDGYTAAFFKESWDIVVDDFVAAVREFFTNGKLLRELNHTIIALIPKSTFVSGRSIADNILLTQELMHNYHLHRGVARCAFKVDIQKAINGSLHGFFKGKRGLRQRDPLSPYLFTLVMEILTLMLQRGVDSANSFVYHRYCSKMKLINLCFADDLLLFSHGDTDSVKVIKGALNEFQEASGLIPSIPKSKGYFCNVLNFTKIAILQILPFEEGYLSVKYLGVPLITSRLVFRDCKELIKKVNIQVDDWKTKFLSAAGRLQLIRSVLSSMHIYRASMFILPSHVLIDIEQIIRRFLWKGRYKVAWEAVSLPKDEGGLGASLWFNNWSTLGPLADFVSSCDRFLAGLNASSNVREVLHDGIWSWPMEL
nr:hypothetical protein [Tanacetum cinerariifolium]